jgi:hypothetical protein
MVQASVKVFTGMQMYKTCPLIALLPILTCSVFARENNADTCQICAKKAVDASKLDGVLGGID